MSHTVFYRKYRPDSFAKLVGQEAVAETVLQALKENSVSHAYLLCGPRGTGKTTVARLIAKGVNCLNLASNGEPCNACENCIAIKEGAFPDIIEIDAASNRSIDDVRELKEKVHFLPLQGKKKVYIIDEVHMLTKEAFNALLKTLEEPPAHVHFILATTERHKVPATIVSRTQNFTLKPLSDEKIIGLLKTVNEQEGITAEENALKIIAQASEGGLRDALTLLEQCVLNKKITEEHVITQLGFVRFAVIEKFVHLWQTGDNTTKLAYLKELYDQGILVDQFVKQAILYLRDQLHSNIEKKKSGNEWYMKAIEALFNCEKQLSLSPLPILALELAYLSLNNEGQTNTVTTGNTIDTNRPAPTTTTPPVHSPNPTPTAPTSNFSPLTSNAAHVTANPPSVPTSTPANPEPSAPPLSAIHFPIALDNALQQKWSTGVKTLPAILKLALRTSEIVKENGHFIIYMNSKFELDKVNTNAGTLAIRELIVGLTGETLDVELKVKEDQPQAEEMLTKVQAIFGSQPA